MEMVLLLVSALLLAACGGAVLMLLHTRRMLAHVIRQRERQDELLRAMRMASPVPYFIKDAHLLYRGCNRAFEHYMEVREDAIIGHSAAELFLCHHYYIGLIRFDKLKIGQDLLFQHRWQ